MPAQLRLLDGDAMTNKMPTAGRILGRAPDAAEQQVGLRSLTAALASGDTDRMAQVICHWVTLQAPETCAFVVRVGDGEPDATVVATNAESAHMLARHFDLPSGSLLLQALREPYRGRVLLTSDRVIVATWSEGLREVYEAKSCLAAPQSLMPGTVVTVLSRGASTALVNDALATLSAFMNAMAGAVAASLPQARINAYIARAKQEWERSADALSELVCLLDRKGRVLRVNRTLERWKLGRVTEVHGKDAHSLLHPKCKQSPCPLKRILEAAWQRVAELQGRYFKVTDAQLKRTLRVALQPMAVEGQLSTSGDSFAVLVVADFTELHQAQKELRVLNEQLEARVRERTEQLQDRNRSLRDQIARAEVAENEVQLSRDELARLSEQLMQTQETERRRIAIELHDAVGSSLGAVKYSLERASEMTRFPELGDPAEVLAQSIERVQHAIDEARSIAMNLRPSLLDDMGVVSAVNWYCRQFGETYVDLHIIADCQITDAEVPERLATPIFRIVQEALNNVVKHARARNALVFLGGAGQKLVLEVRDDGVGFDKSSTRAGGSTGLGIVGMRERASITGGKFSLISGEDVSTRVRVEWALSESDLARGG